MLAVARIEASETTRCERARQRGGGDELSCGAWRVERGRVPARERQERRDDRSGTGRREADDVPLTGSSRSAARRPRSTKRSQGKHALAPVEPFHSRQLKDPEQVPPASPPQGCAQSPAGLSLPNAAVHTCPAGHAGPPSTYPCVAAKLHSERHALPLTCRQYSPVGQYAAPALRDVAQLPRVPRSRPARTTRSAIRCSCRAGGTCRSMRDLRRHRSRSRRRHYRRRRTCNSPHRLPSGCTPRSGCHTRSSRCMARRTGTRPPPPPSDGRLARHSSPVAHPTEGLHGDPSSGGAHVPSSPCCAFP